MAEARDEHHWISYRFSFAGERPDAEFLVLLDRRTLIAVPPEESAEQDWTRLEYRQCPICPLSPATVRNCPVAYNISGLVGSFRTMISYDTVETCVEVPERRYHKRDSIQQSLRSILGIYMAASGCPHMKVLKPMVRFHLPFASPHESLYRNVTSYLLHQYFEYLDGRRPDLDLRELKRLHDAVDEVNRGILARIEGVVEGDADSNALLILGTLGMLLQRRIDGGLEEFKHLYSD